MARRDLETSVASEGIFGEEFGYVRGDEDESADDVSRYQTNRSGCQSNLPQSHHVQGTVRRQVRICMRLVRGRLPLSQCLLLAGLWLQTEAPIPRSGCLLDVQYRGRLLPGHVTDRRPTPHVHG